MTKKFLLLSLIVTSFLLFAKCSKDLNDPEFDFYVSSRNPNKPIVTETTNNLSFPAIAVDGFAITPLTSSSFLVPYAGTYPGLTAEEIAALGSGPWYAQKTTGNVWQAEFANRGTEDVTYIDWGDNIESVYPKIRLPFRLEVTLYKDLGEETMTAYNMAVLEYPSSSTELQGTNTITAENNFATVISSRPKLVIQYLKSSVPALTWIPLISQWVNIDDSEEVPVVTYYNIVPVSFAPELNVGGKYIYGASQGGWKPTLTGYYRITFYLPPTPGSGVNLAQAMIANASNDFTGSLEGTAATPEVDAANNLTYVDVLVKSGGRR